MKNSKLKIFLSSAETIGGNLDILIQILLRLPAKSLLKFKCVSKQFLSLVSDPKFCVCHARHQKSHNPTPNALLLNRNFSPFPQSQVVPLKDTTQVPPLDFLNPRIVKIENSCNGLLLCASRVLLYSDIEDYSIEVQEYFICNPTTRQFRRLPFPDYIPAGSAVPDLGPFLSLSFDPLKSPHYKVIYLHYLGVDLENLTYNFVLDVYSSEIESWTPTPIPFPYLCGIVMRAGVFCNGAVHWPVIGRPSLYFVVDDYKLKTMPMPPVPHVSRLNHFGESLGHLHMVVSNDRNILPLQFDVWEMASDYSGWFVRYHVDLSSVRAVLSNQRWHHGTILTEFSVLSIIRAGKEEESKIILLHDAGRAMSYNPHDGTTRKLCHLESIGGSSRLDYEGLDGYEYFETLACV